MILQTSSINNNRTHLRFVQGRLLHTVDRSDTIDTTDGYFITSDPIPGGQHFFLCVKTGYKLAYVVFFDRNLRKYLPYDGWRSWNQSIVSPANGPHPKDNCFSPSGACRATWIPAECYCRVVVCREETMLDGWVGDLVDGASLTPDEDFLDKFRLFDNVLMQRDRTYTPRNYKQGMQAARQVNAVYTPVRVQPKRNATDGTGHTGLEESQISFGVPYSATPQFGGQLNYGQTGMEAYLSAWGNRRSLMYTEYPKNNISEYGINYLQEKHVVDMGLYVYGMVCNDAASTVLGLAARCDQSMWGNMSSLMYSTPEEMLADNGAKLRAFDVVVAGTAHLFVITDVFNYGNERYFELFECANGTTGGRFYLVTVQRLFDKTKTYDDRGYKFYRLKSSAFAKLGNPMGRFYLENIPSLPTEVRKRGTRFVPNDDICTFLGNKVTIAAGDMLWLNVRQYNGDTRETFTHLRFKRYDSTQQAYTLVETVEMEEPVAAHKTTFADGDVVWDIDVSARFASRPLDLEGSHTGLWQVTAYNPTISRESAPVEFEVLDFRLLSAKCGYNKGMTFVSFDLPASLRDGRHVFFRQMKADTEPLFNNLLTYWTDLASNDTNVVLCTINSTGCKKVRMTVRGTYNYCHKDMETTDVWDYAHIGGITEEKGYINTSGAVVSGSSTKVYSYDATGLRGQRLTAVFRNIYAGGNSMAYRVAQYDENGDFIPGTLVTLKAANSPAGDGTTVVVPIGAVSNDCTTMKFNFYYEEVATLGIFKDTDVSIPQIPTTEPIGNNGTVEF